MRPTGCTFLSRGGAPCAISFHAMQIPSASPRLRLALCAAIAFFVPFLLFLPSVRFPLVALDDSAYVAGNPLAQSPLSAHNAARAFAFRSPAPMYVPVLWLSYMLDSTLWGPHPWGYHLGNAILHALGSLLLFALLRRLAGRPPIAIHPPPLVSPLLLALLWSCHPLRVESVAWVAERKDCLAVVFCLLTVLSWLAAAGDASSRSRRAVFWGLAFVCFSLGLLSKPSLVPLPFLLLAIAAPPFSRTWAFGRAGSVLAAFPFFAVAVACSLATTRLHALANSFTSPPLLSRLATIPSVFFFYLSKILFPRGLSVLYPAWTIPLGWGVLLALPCLALSAAVFARRRGNPHLWLGGLWILLFFLPVSGIVPVPFNQVADRFACLPTIGLSIALLPWFSAPGRKRCLFLALAVVACAVWSAAILPNWRSDAALYLPARRHVPDHPVIRGFDATTARQHGDFAVSRECIARAQQAQMGEARTLDYPLLLLEARNVKALEGPEAALLYLQSIPPPPNALPQWAELVVAAQLALDRNEEALATAVGALPRAAPGGSSRTALLEAAMIASHRMGNPGDALRFARLAGIVSRETAGIDSHHFLDYYLHLWEDDDRVAALDYFRQIVREYPDPGVLNNIAWILGSAFHSPAPPAEAVGLARRALAAVPSSSALRTTFLDTLSVALASEGDFPAAIAAATEAIALLPPDSPVRPAMERRLDLYRQSLPYREIKRAPVLVSDYTYDPHL